MKDVMKEEIKVKENETFDEYFERTKNLLNDTNCIYPILMEASGNFDDEINKYYNLIDYSKLTKYQLQSLFDLNSSILNYIKNINFDILLIWNEMIDPDYENCKETIKKATPYNQYDIKKLIKANKNILYYLDYNKIEKDTLFDLLLNE